MVSRLPQPGRRQRPQGARRRRHEARRRTWRRRSRTLIWRADELAGPDERRPRPRHRRDAAQLDRYLEHRARPRRGASAPTLRVVLDCANGSGGAWRRRSWPPPAPRSRCTSTRPTAPTSTSAAAPRRPRRSPPRRGRAGADVGFALDGDADRCVAVDERGRVVDGDQLLGIIALDRLARGALAGGDARRQRALQRRSGRRRRGAPAGASCARRSATSTSSTPCSSRAPALGGEKSGHVIVREHATQRRRHRDRARGAAHPGPRRAAAVGAGRAGAALPAGAARGPRPPQGPVGGRPAAGRPPSARPRRSWPGGAGPGPAVGHGAGAADHGRGRGRGARRSSWPTRWLPSRPSVYTDGPPDRREERQTSMCGIVGYIGPREAAPILLEGLARLEYRGYDSAGIALVTADGRAVRREARRQAGQPAHRAARRRRRSAAVGLAHTRWATHGRPNDLNAHPARRLHRRHHGHPQRHHRELPGAPRRPRGARPRASTPRPTRRRSRTSSRRPTRATSRTPCAPRCARPQGAYAVAVLHRGEPGRLVGARHERAAHRGPRRGRELPRLGRGGGAGPHPPGHLPRGGRRRRPARRRRSSSPASTASARERAGARHRLVHRGRREGRLRALHAQGDARAAGGHPLRHRRPHPRRRDPASTSWTPVVDAHRAPPTGSSSSPAAAPRTPRPSAATRHPGLGRAAGALEHRLRVPLLARRRSTSGRWSSPSPSRARRPTPSRPTRWPASRAAPSSRSPTPSARPSRARRTRCCSSRPGPRSRSWPPRPS